MNEIKGLGLLISVMGFSINLGLYAINKSIISLKMTLFELNNRSKNNG